MVILYDALDEDRLYPSSDGKPMADNTKQFNWIVLIKENLEIIFANVANVFIAGDLLWYPERSLLTGSVAPDVMVVFGRTKGDRKSYRQWRENNIGPQVVFEILSPSNSNEEMARKQAFYERHGVEEYYLYDPDDQGIEGWLRQGDRLVSIPSLEDWVSPRLGIRFDMSQGELVLWRPDGERFLSPVELHQRYRAQQAETEAERQRAESAEQKLSTLMEKLQDLSPEQRKLLGLGE
jgi:Uma2 family endonuclease